MKIEEYISGVKTVRIIDDGLSLASEDLKTSRLSVCSSCEHYSTDMCLQCSCLIHVKISQVDSTCPEGKW